MIFRQPFIGGAVVALCTAYVLFQRRHDLLSLVRSVKPHSHGRHSHKLSNVTSWQSAHEMIMSGEYDNMADEAALLSIIEGGLKVDEKAVVAMADVLFFGTLTREPDYMQAYAMYEKSFHAHHNAHAAHMLAIYHAEGLGVPVNVAKALVLLKAAASANYMPSQLVLAHWYSLGLHVNVECASARQLLFQAASVVHEQVRRRRRKYRSVVPPESIVETNSRKDVMSMFPSRDLIEYYRYSADRGQIESQTILGQVHYHGGADWDPDYPAALSYFQSAARQGGAVAQGYLGQMYLRGEGVPENPSMAYKYFKASAEGGSAMGLNGMGMCYWRGIEVVKDYEEAWDFFDKAVAKDHPDALYNVAMMLKEWNQPLLADSIVSYLMKAVKNGHLLAHYELAKTYSRQPGYCTLTTYLLRQFVEKGDQSFVMMEQAHRHYRLGQHNQAVSRYLFMATQGFEVAQSNLAKLLHGYDDERAVVWWNRSSLQGNFRSRVRVGDYFDRHFQPESLAKAAAAAHYLSAALHKTPQASYNMALCYKHGRGVPRDRDLYDLFMSDCLRYDKTGTAKWPVMLTMRYFVVVDWLKRYGWLIVFIFVLWLVVFSVMVGVLLLYEHVNERPQQQERRNADHLGEPRQ